MVFGRGGPSRETELRQVPGIVDEDAEEQRELPQQRAKPPEHDVMPGWLSRRFANVDLDRVCAYRTWKIVRIKDKSLGLTYWSIVAAVVLYVVVFCFSIGGNHQQQEPGVGTVLTKVSGKVYSADKIFTSPDIVFPVIDPSGAFLLTRYVRVNQRRGVCADYDSSPQCPCTGENCPRANRTYCEAETWCPSLGDYNFKDGELPAGALVDELLGLENVKLSIRAGISFPGIGNRFFVYGASPGATDQFKNITLKSLLELTDPPQKLDAELIRTGALIGVSFFWNCDVENDCEPSIVIKRLDSGQGFVQKRSNHFREEQGGVEKRNAKYLTGIRILVDSSGIGRRFELTLAIIQIGVAICLIRSAGMIADFLMMHSHGWAASLSTQFYDYYMKKQEAYYACKVIETGDYSDLQDRVNLIHQAKGRQLQTGHLAGSQVYFGLGPGGRAGLPSTALRGRF